MVVSDDGTAVEGGATIVGAEERKKAAEDESGKMVELRPSKRFPPVRVPQFATGEIESDFSLADLAAKLDPFKKLGERLATDPEKEFRRERLSATIEYGPDGLPRTKLVTGQAVDRIAASSRELTLDEAKLELLKRIFAAEIVAQRPKEKNAARRIINAFVKGLGSKAKAVLAGYLDTAAGSLIRKIAEEQRKAAKKPRYAGLVRLKHRTNGRDDAR